MTHGFPQSVRRRGSRKSLPKEVGQAGGSVRPRESLRGPSKVVSDGFALRWRRLLLGAGGESIKVLLEVRHVDGAIGQQRIGEDADGLAGELAKEPLDACLARALRLGVALVVTVALKTRLALVVKRTRRLRGLEWERTATDLHSSMKNV